MNKMFSKLIAVTNVSSVLGLFMVLLLANLQSVAHADEQDTLNFIAGITTRYDDNLFRAVGDGGSDTVVSPFVGLRLDKQYSLQRFRVNVNIADNRYRNNDYLNFVAKNFDASWLWAFTPRLTGSISANRSESLNNFNDTLNTLQNIRTDQTQAFSFHYNPGGGWHAIAGLTRRTSQNSQTFNQQASFSTNGVDFGTKYVFPSQTQISLLNHIRKGSIDDRQITTENEDLFDRGFRENETEVRLDWFLTAKSTINIVTSYVKRKSDNFSQRDFSGFQGSVNYLWEPTAKITVALAASSDLNGFQTQFNSYARATTLSLTPRYQLSPKISLSSNLNILKREFLGEGPLVQVGRARSDDQKSYGVGLLWRPTRNSSIGVNLQHIELDSTEDFFDFESNTASISGNVLF
jgi:exopolysaccharide biosynthesis operon protein EpsL